MKVRVRYIGLEVVNHWGQDSPEFDEVQREIIIERETPPKVGEKINIDDLNPSNPKINLVITSVIISNDLARPDGLGAFAQARFERRKQ